MGDSFFRGSAAPARHGFGSKPLAFVAWCGLALGCTAPSMSAANAERVRFNAAFLPEDSRHLDLSAYQSGNPVLPGKYRADVMLNGQLTTRQDVRVDANSDGSNPVVCVTRELLELLGVDVGRLTAWPAGQQAGSCTSLGTLVESGSAIFTPENQLLDISIPQAALRRNARGHVSPELWDRGVTAAMLGYNFNASHNTTRSGNFSSAYLGLDGGINAGDWRLRHSGSMSWQPRTGARYHALNTYVQRDVTSLKSQLTLGQANTSGEIFDTLPYSGVQLASDDRMLPDSMRGYAPVIRGIARTNARVTVRQSGNVLLETTVAPGAFVIDDLYPTGYGGDLNVTVSEADGTQQSFVVPFASVSQLLRPGTLRFSLAGGQTRSNFVVELGEASQQVAPRAGAVVYPKYGTRNGRALLINVRLDDGSPLPFGANVVGADGGSIGVAGQGGQLYVRVKEDTRQLVVSWGSQARQRCALTLPAWPGQAGENGPLRLDACVPPANASRTPCLRQQARTGSHEDVELDANRAAAVRNLVDGNRGHGDDLQL
jgi:outer membrane usher protein FimD/PapC